MFLPTEVRCAIDALENAGYSAFVVGGCVRDWLLGLTPHDYDLCTAAAPEEIQAVFADYRQFTAGIKHGTVGVVIGETVLEITAFRTEGDYGDSRHPGWVRFVSDIEADLARRDFTVNAMAYSPTRGLRDPFGGEQDLKNRVLRCVGNPSLRFTEDALRILRGLRFAARFGLTIEEETLKAMFALRGRMDALARERVFEELSRLLPAAHAGELVQWGGILAAAVPELQPMLGFSQHSPHHAYDVFTHTAFVVENVPADTVLRWAALLHDVGKVPCFTTDETGRGHFYGHAKVGAEMADKIFLRLKAPTALREEAVFLIAQHMTKLTEDKKALKRFCARWGMERVRRLLALQRADMGSKGTGENEDDGIFDRIEGLLQALEAENACLTLKDLQINGHDLTALGCSGAAIGRQLNRLLTLVMDETLPNEKAALLAAAIDDLENSHGI